MKETMKGITYHADIDSGGYDVYRDGKEIGFVRRTGTQWTARIDGLGGWTSDTTRTAATRGALQALEAMQDRKAAEAARDARLKAAATEHDAKMDEHAADVAAKRAADDNGPFDVNLELAVQARAQQGTLTIEQAVNAAPGHYDKLSFTPAMDGVRVTTGSGKHLGTMTRRVDDGVAMATPGGWVTAFGTTPTKAFEALYGRAVLLANADWAGSMECAEAIKFSDLMALPKAARPEVHTIANPGDGSQCGLVNLEAYRGYVDSLPITAADVANLGTAVADLDTTTEAVIDAAILVDENSPGWYDMRTAVRDHLKNDLAKLEGGHELDGPWRLTRLTVKLPTLPQTFEVIVAPAGTRMRPNRWVVITAPDTCEAAL